MAVIDEADVAQRLRLLADQTMEHAIVLADADGSIAWWSPGAAEAFGYQAADIVGKPLDILFTPEEQVGGLAAHERDVASSNDEAEDDRWLQRADGSRFWAAGMLTPIRDGTGAILGFGKILRNRTDLKEQLETARNTAAALAESNRRKDAFMSTLSHELRNPMGPLANAVYIIRTSGGSPAETEQALRVIERQIDILRRLVDDLLDTTRIGAGKMELQVRSVVVQDLVNDVAAALRQELEQKRHDLRVILPDGAIEIEADRERLAQVFHNLLRNAIKYTPAKGVIWIKATVEGDEAVVRFEDTGIGIATDMLPRIFEMFTQVDAARSVAPGGLGIGLALVKELVALHQGTIQVRSDGLGKGSEFIVRLPLKRLHRK
jgi:two-component system CheB/CheR fusion protein